MKKFYRLLLSLLLFCACVRAQDAEPAPESSDARWLFDILAPYGGRDDFVRGLRELKPKLQEPVVWQRLVKMVRDASTHDFIEKLPPKEETLTAIRLLGNVQNDEAVDVIAPYLKHQSFKVREFAGEYLRITQNPRAVPPLKSALLDLERQLPAALVLDSGTEASINALTTYFRSLSMIRSDDALAALDASLARLKARYGNSTVGSELLRQLEHIRETGGIQEYRRAAADPSVPATTEPPPQSAPLPATPVPSAAPAASPQPATPAAQAPIASVEQRAPAWRWVVGGILALAVIALLVWKRRA